MNSIEFMDLSEPSITAIYSNSLTYYYIPQYWC